MARQVSIKICSFCNHVYGHTKPDGTLHRNIDKNITCSGYCDPQDTVVTFDDNNQVAKMEPVSMGGCEPLHT